MKVAIIGCTHAGTAAILNVTEQYPDAEITVYERNDNISFLSCGIALYVGGVIEDPQGLFYSSPEELEKLGVEMRMQHDVLDVNLKEKTLKARNLQTDQEVEDSFDKLIITIGSWPIIPRLEGIDLENVLLSKNFTHSNTIIKKAEQAEKIVVIGAGYIGVELVEAFAMQGKEVTLIDMEERILSRYLDKEFTDLAEQALAKHGVRLALGELVNKLTGQNGQVSKVITNKGEHEADLVIMCIGFKPNTELFKGQLEMLDNGAIVVNEYMETSQPGVFAAGDCCAVKYNPTRDYQYIPLATNAVRMGTLAGKNLVQQTVKHLGTQGTSGIKIYDLCIAATGLTEDTAKANGMEVQAVLVSDNYRPEFMPTTDEATLKVVYEEKSHRIVGAQLICGTDLTQSINTMSVVIQNEMTIEELAFVDFFFQPHFNKPWNLLNLAGLEALKTK